MYNVPLEERFPGIRPAWESASPAPIVEPADDELVDAERFRQLLPPTKNTTDPTATAAAPPATKDEGEPDVWSTATSPAVLPSKTVVSPAFGLLLGGIAVAAYSLYISKY